MNAYRTSGYLLIFLGVICAGCSKEPNAVGINLIPGSEKFKAHDTTVASFNDTTFRAASVNGFAINVLTGNYSSVKCMALLRFTASLPDSLKLAGVQFSSAKLNLTVNYKWPVTSTTIPGSFDVTEVTTPWSETTTPSDSLDAFLLPVPHVVAPPITITTQDTITIGKVLSTQLDLATVRRWLTASPDSAGLLSVNLNMAIVPGSGLTNVGIWGFTEFGTSTPPSLTLVYSENGIVDSVTLNTGEDTFLASGPSVSSLGLIETEGGISVRSRVRFYIKPISDSIGKAIINNAVLRLTPNTSASVLGLGSEDSLVAYFSGSASAPDSVQTSSYAYGYRQINTQTTDTTYVFSLTSIVQQWINSPSNNFGITLRSINDVSSVDKLVFYNSQDPTRAPKLFITYTKK